MMENKKLAEKSGDNQNGLVGKLAAWYESLLKEPNPKELRRYTKRVRRACQSEEGVKDVKKTKLYKKALKKIKNLKPSSSNPKQLIKDITPYLDLIQGVCET